MMKKTILAVIIVVIAIPAVADETDRYIAPQHIREEILERVLRPCDEVTSDAKSKEMLADFMQVTIDVLDWIAEREQIIANEPDITERYRLYKEAIDYCINEADKVIDSYGIPSYSDIAEEIEEHVANPCVDAMVTTRSWSWHEYTDDHEFAEYLEEFTEEVEESKTPEEKAEDRNDARKSIDEFIQQLIDTTYKYRGSVSKADRTKFLKKAGKNCAERMTS